MANNLITVNRVTREAIRLFNETNGFINCIEYTVHEVPAAPPLLENIVSPQAAVALGVAAAVIKNPGVTRRFWDPSTWNNQQGSAGRDVPSSAGRPSSPDHQRTTGDR